MVSENEEPRKQPLILRFHSKLESFFETPVVWFRKNIIEPNQKEYYYYHQQYRRVPTIDQCYSDDVVCKFEAQQQFHRDQQVDSNILAILRQRYEHCIAYEAPNRKKCYPLYEYYEQAAAEWFCKYGDLGHSLDAEKAYFKQKHRMVWERRHGPVGTGTEGNRPPPKQPDEGFVRRMQN